MEQLKKAENILLKQQNEESNSSDYSNEFYSIIPYFIDKSSIKMKHNQRNKFEIIQVLIDILNVNESTNWNLKSTISSKYNAMGCFIQELNKNSIEYLNFKNEIEIQNNYKIHNIYEILRPNEYLMFRNDLNNVKQLYHGSRINNYLGILSRGLLLPKYTATSASTQDDLSLGPGLYFSDSAHFSLGYTNKSRENNKRLLTVCEIALGECKTYYNKETSLIKPPDGFNSVMGIADNNNTNNDSKFTHNEYVIYNTNQCKLKYLIEIESLPFIIKNDVTKYEIDLNLKDKIIYSNDLLLSIDDDSSNNNNDLTNLISETGKSVSLQSVHIRTKIIDTICKVTIYQEYINNEQIAIESKYVFPLVDSACVCGFEAFINDKRQKKS